MFCMHVIGLIISICAQLTLRANARCNEKRCTCETQKSDDEYAQKTFRNFGFGRPFGVSFALAIFLILIAGLFGVNFACKAKQFSFSKRVSSVAKYFQSLQMAMPIVENDVVELNVGGVKFSTSADTLGRDVDSMLAAMLRNSDSLDSKQIKKGRIFIDRDGERFRAVLNYLRNPAAFVKTQLETLSAARELLEEQEFSVGRP